VSGGPGDRGELGPLEARVPEALRRSAAYEVPAPPRVIAKLDANELPYRLPVELRAELGRLLAEVAIERYPDPAASRLRAVVARQLGVAGDQLVFGNGSDELIAMLCSAFAARRGARPAAILYPGPSFVYYQLSAIARGVEPIEVPLTASFELDEAAVLRGIEEHRPSVVFLALPNNPTGTLWRVGFVAELAARHRDVAIISDEAYFAYCGATSLPVLADHPNLVVLRTLSKLGMAGLRVGFAISSPAIAGLLEKLRPPYNLSALDQRAAEFLLERRCRHRARPAGRRAHRPRLRGVRQRGEPGARPDARCVGAVAAPRRCRRHGAAVRWRPARRLPPDHRRHAGRDRRAARRAVTRRVPGPIAQRASRLAPRAPPRRPHGCEEPSPGLLGTVVLPLGCGLATLVGPALVGPRHLSCSTQQFHDFSPR
jgi:histidinol-phosphate aminotransferase